MMKNILFATMMIGAFALMSNDSYAQNLQFNSAIFYEYEGGQANGNGTIDIVLTAPLIVGPNQVLKITAGSVTLGGPNNMGHLIYLTINGNFMAPGEMYLPTGTYEIGFCDLFNVTGPVKGMISGILYDIVP